MRITLFIFFSLIFVNFKIEAQDSTEVVAFQYSLKKNTRKLESITVSKFFGEVLLTETELDADSSFLSKVYYIYDTIYKKVDDERSQIRKLIKKYDFIEKSVFTIRTNKIVTPDFGEYNSITFYNKENKILKVISFNRQQIPTHKTVRIYNERGIFLREKEFTFESSKGFIPL